MFYVHLYRGAEVWITPSKDAEYAIDTLVFDGKHYQQVVDYYNFAADTLPDPLNKPLPFNEHDWRLCTSKASRAAYTVTDQRRSPFTDLDTDTEPSLDTADACTDIDTDDETIVIAGWDF